MPGLACDGGAAATLACAEASLVLGGFNMAHEWVDGKDIVAPAKLLRRVRIDLTTLGL